MRQSKQAGYGVVELILILVILGLIGFIGWRVWLANQPEDTTIPYAEPTSQSTEPEAPTIKSADDLNTAEKALDNTQVEGESTRELENQLNF